MVCECSYRYVFNFANYYCCCCCYRFVHRTAAVAPIAACLVEEKFRITRIFFRSSKLRDRYANSNRLRPDNNRCVLQYATHIYNYTLERVPTGKI